MEEPRRRDTDFLPAGMALPPAGSRPTRLTPPFPSRRLDRRLLDLIFPPRCAGCRRPGAWICRRCWGRVPWLRSDACPRCEGPSAHGELCLGCLTLARQRRSGAAGAAIAEPVVFRGVARFEGSARQAIHELKYSAHYDIATVLGPLMAERMAEHSQAVLVPVPLHPSRKRQRGYNQSELLAKEIGRSLNWPVVRGRLRRSRKTADQVTLDAGLRAGNVAGAFTWRGTGIGGAIILVDDVCTTGAALDACAEAVREAGMNDVAGLVFASASRPRPVRR